MKRTTPEAGTAERNVPMIDTDTAIAELERGFAEAAARAPGALVETNYRIAGQPIRLRVVGTELAADFDRALYLVRATDGADPALTIEVWDNTTNDPAIWTLWGGVRPN